MSARRQDGDMKSVKAAKRERRDHRAAKEPRHEDSRPSIRVFGGVMDPEVHARVRSITGGFDPDAGWTEVGPRLLPVLKRVDHPYPAGAAPLHLHVPPGIWTGFGIDLGPAFGHVSAPMVAAWGVDHATLLGTALENLRRRIAVEPPQVQDVVVDGESIVAIQGQGWGSSLLLLPEALQPILRARPRVLLAPVRNTLLALPEDCDLELAAGLWHALAAGAHDELDVGPLRWTGATVTSFADPSLGLPN
jgi:hypothetical protein